MAVHAETRTKRTLGSVASIVLITAAGLLVLGAAVPRLVPTAVMLFLPLIAVATAGTTARTFHVGAAAAAVLYALRLILAGALAPLFGAWWFHGPWVAYPFSVATWLMGAVVAYFVVAGVALLLIAAFHGHSRVTMWTKIVFGALCAAFLLVSWRSLDA